MSRHPSFILGYHGCERETAQAVVRREKPLRPGTGKYHWLGTGIYFWEDDPLRAIEWAKGRPGKRALKDPWVVGAVIDLGNCLDLRVRENVELVRQAHQLLGAEAQEANMELPVNQEAPNDKSPDKVMRWLDHLVIERLHRMLEENNEPQFDTVRALFHEGMKLYKESGFLEKTHTEIAVRSERHIIGYFLPKETPLLLQAAARVAADP
ncbi:MAG TPA: hypothetical protein VGF71_12340 [Caulobacteraceae bacterium]